MSAISDMNREQMKTFVALLPVLFLGACYGQATPESCHKKYVVNGRGDDVRDTYQACLDRARGHQEGIPQDVAQLRDRIQFESGCSHVSLKVLEWTGRLATRVGADACGRRLVYGRQLRRRFGMRSARNAHWELVADSAAVVPNVAPAIQVTNVYAPSSTPAPPPSTTVANPYAEP